MCLAKSATMLCVMTVVSVSITIILSINKLVPVVAVNGENPDSLGVDLIANNTGS